MISVAQAAGRPAVQPAEGPPVLVSVSQLTKSYGSRPAVSAVTMLPFRRTSARRRPSGLATGYATC